MYMDNSIKNTPKIRIGNDITLDVCISKKYINDAINIKSVKCVLVNTTMAFEFEDHCHHHNHCTCAHNHRHHRCIEDHRPTACSLHSCGHRCYHCDPHNHHCTGYGQAPLLCENIHHHYHPCVCHHGQLGCMHHDHHHIESAGIFDQFITEHLKRNIVLHHDLQNHPITPFQYAPKITSTPERNRFYITFPAEDQMFIGDYMLIVTAEVYDQGFNVNNTRTITIDYRSVFELVETTEEADGDFVISVGSSSSEGVDRICACGPKIDRVLKGNAGTLGVKAVMNGSSDYNDIVWSNPTGGLDLINKTGDVLQYVGKCCDIEKGEETFTVRASSKYFSDKFIDFDVTVFNYADRVQVCSAEDYILGEPLGLNEQAKFTAEVVMQNGERVSSYKKNNQTVSATKVDGYVKDDMGETLATITNNGAGTYTVTNTNPYSQERIIRILVKSSLPTEDGHSIQTYVVFKLEPKEIRMTKDIYATEMQYNDNDYFVNTTMSNDDIIKLDLNEAVGWTNK